MSTVRDENRVIQGLWIGPRLSTIEDLSIRSFLVHGHEYHLYVYGEIENVPPGTVLKDANEILPFSRVFKYRDYDSYAGFANIFRYNLLRRKGGWWADMDLICLKPFDFPDQYLFSSEAQQESQSSHLAVGALKVPAASDLMTHLCDECEKKNPAELTWGETGPRLFSSAVKKLGLEAAAADPAVFCPIPYFRWKDLLDPDVPWRFSEEVYAVHLWNEMWRREGFGKDDEYDPRSLYEHLKRLYPKTGPAGSAQPRGSAAKPAADPLKKGEKPKAPSGSMAPRRKSPRSSPTVSALVLSRNGAPRLERCLESICRTGFADELVVCVDSATTDDTLEIAKRFTPNVHVVETSGYIESALQKITAFCSCDFVLRVDDDETLDGNWDKQSFQLLALYNSLSHAWLPTRWIVPPGNVFISSNHWYPDPHPRIYVNDPTRLTWPRQVHEEISVLGRGIHLFDRWISHHALVDRPRGERWRRCAKYRELNPDNDQSRYYLYEDFPYSVLPCDASAMDAAPEKPQRSPWNREYVPGSLIDFSTAGNSMDYVRAGWAFPEVWGTWTVGPQAAICLPLSEPLSGAAILTAEVTPYLNLQHPTLLVEVFCGDAMVGRWSLNRTAFTRRDIPIDSSLLRGNSQPQFLFKIHDPRSPADGDGRSDPRLLGLGFRSLRLQSADAAAPAKTGEVPETACGEEHSEQALTAWKRALSMSSWKLFGRTRQPAYSWLPRTTDESEEK